MTRMMKNSGIEWMGQVPISWTIGIVKQHFVRKNEKAEQNDPVVLSLARTGVKVRDISNNEGQLAESYYNYNPVKPGDLLLNPMDLYSGANCSISKISGVISPAYVNLRHDEKTSPVYFDYYFKLQYWSMAFFAHGKGVSYDNRWTLNTDTLMHYPIIIPPFKEQQAIADYLDDKCGAIDSAIAKQRDIIERLREYKNAVITETVCRGLDPNAPMKDSGIEWVGQIPAHWDKIKLNNVLAKIGSGTTPKEEELYEGGVPWLNTGDLTDGEIYNIQKSIKHKALEKYSTLQVFHPNDVVIAMYGATIGKLGILTIKAATNQACCVMTPNETLYFKYLFYYLWAAKTYLTSRSFGAGQPNISQGTIKKLVMIKLPYSEQQEIANYLDARCGVIDSVIAKRERLIELLTEYKHSLIYECVTGKKDVANV